MDRVISQTKYNRKHHKKYYKYHMFYRSKSTYLIIFIMLFTIYYSVRQTLILENIMQVMISWGLTGFTLMIIPMMMLLQVNEIVRRESQERKDSTEIIVATKDKITRNNDKLPGKVILGWYQIEAVRETKDFIYIYTGPKQGTFIPKDCIVEGDVELFRKLARNHMKKNRRGKANYKIHKEKKKNG